MPFILLFLFFCWEEGPCTLSDHPGRVLFHCGALYTPCHQLFLSKSLLLNSYLYFLEIRFKFILHATIQVAGGS
uniref:Putative ovule protein n=1 Tax=Solanum chacoense TaxID=4108 RepID=A0A0V0HIR7_SOLCH